MQVQERSLNPSSSKAGPVGLAAAGLFIGLGGILHPRVDTSLDFEHGLAGMFESSAWAGSHLLTMAGFVALAASLAVLTRGSLLGRIAAIAAAFAAIESVPHLLAASDSRLVDLHTALQAISTPLVGLSLAALAATRELDAGRVVTALAVVGGLVFALAGPAIALTENPELSPLFVGSAGLAVWAVVAGTRRTRELTLAPAR
jgi:hypothetical protein